MWALHPDFHPSTAPATRQTTIVPRCWADNSVFKPGIKPSECMALGDGRIGLCKRHTLEILGSTGGAR